MKENILAIFKSKEVVTGAHKRYFELLKQLEQKGYKINLISPAELKREKVNNIQIPEVIFNLPVPNALQLAFLILFNIEKIKKQASDSEAILVFGFSHILAGLVLKMLFSTPVVFGVRANIVESRKHSANIQNEFLFKLYLKLISLSEGFIYKRVDQIIVQNSYDKKEILKRNSIEARKIEIIPNNINVSWMDENYKNTNTSSQLKNLIFIGSLSKRKGIMYLLPAVKKLIANNKDIQLDVLGTGSLEPKIKDYINKHNLSKQVKLHGYVENPLEFLSSSDLLVVPSLSDSFPNTVLESLHVGTPVIGSRVGGIVDQLKYNKLLFRPGSTEAIYNKLLALLEQQEYLDCKSKCQERQDYFIFDWAEKFEQIISDL